MEKLKDSLITLNKALKTLDSALKLIITIKESSHSDELILACQDSIVQRFEYCYESFWKFLKLHFETIHEIETEMVKSPKNVFRMCTHLKICTEAEGEILIKMANARNATSHMYSLTEVYAILPSVPEYYTTMIKIIEKLELEL